MNKLHLISILSILVILSSCKTRKNDTADQVVIPPAEVKTPEKAIQNYSIVDGMNLFAFEMYKEIAESKNQVFSPFSISTALAMTYAGAEGNTKKEFIEVMHFQEDQQAFNSAFHQIISDIESAQNKDLQLSIANALWPQSGYSFLEEYLQQMKSFYGVDVQSLDYKTDPEKARLIINKWVEEKTQDKIRNLLKEGVLSPLTRMVLTNAIYFKGNWKYEFNEDDTDKDGVFYLNKTEEVKAEMMNITKPAIKHMQNEDFSMLELPYSNDSLSMVFILPNEKDGIKKLEDKLSYDMYKQAYNQMQKRKVVISIPKFTMEFELDLVKKFEGMGMTDAFSGKADFSGMTGKKDLQIDKVIHKAFIEVNESGTEAAAATAVIMIEKSSAVPNKPLLYYFIADHPFLYLIKDNQNGAILFMGKLMLPKS